MAGNINDITKLIIKARDKVRKESIADADAESASRIRWPVDCSIGPGLEGAIACQSKVGFVNGLSGRLIYRGYDVFDLCAHTDYEQVAYLLVRGRLPTKRQYDNYRRKLTRYRQVPATLRMMMGFPIEQMNTMAALRLGTNLLRHQVTWRDISSARPSPYDAVAADEDSIPMETPPTGESHAIYEFGHWRKTKPEDAPQATDDAAGLEACNRLVGGIPTIAAAILRLRSGQMPVDPDPELGHAANFLYMMTGKKPSDEEARIMDTALILHADHGMNASTFAAMVVASTMSDIYFSVGAGVAALSGPLHGGANEQALLTLQEIGAVENVGPWFQRARRAKQKIPGFGHRVYKTYDPRARALGPLARELSRSRPESAKLFRVASALEKEVIASLGKEKKVFPNVDFYSGLVYSALGIPPEMFTPIFAVSRVAGWTARIMEYLKNNRIFRPRALYTGGVDRELVPMDDR